MQLIFGHSERSCTELGLARGCLGVSRSQGTCIYRCKAGFSFYPRSAYRHSQEIRVDRMKSGAHCIALHCMAWHDR